MRTGMTSARKGGSRSLCDFRAAKIESKPWVFPTEDRNPSWCVAQRQVVRVKSYEQVPGVGGELREERKRRGVFEPTRSILELPDSAHIMACVTSRAGDEMLPGRLDPPDLRA